MGVARWRTIVESIYTEHIDEDIFELALKYFNNIPYKTKNIIEAIQNENYDLAAKEIHSMKGSSGSYGFQELYRKTVYLEGLITDRKFHEAQTVLKEILSYSASCKMIACPEE